VNLSQSTWAQQCWQARRGSISAAHRTHGALPDPVALHDVRLVLAAAAAPDVNQGGDDVPTAPHAALKPRHAWGGGKGGVGAILTVS
jgi:hypothetical protein